MSRRTRIHANAVPDGYTPHDGTGQPVDLGERVDIIPRRGSRMNVSVAGLASFAEDPWTWKAGSTAAFDIVAWRAAGPQPD